MAKKTFYWFTFEDGSRVCTRGFSAAELRREVAEHGKLISKVVAE